MNKCLIWNFQQIFRKKKKTVSKIILIKSKQTDKKSLAWNKISFVVFVCESDQRFKN